MSIDSYSREYENLPSIVISRRKNMIMILHMSIPVFFVQTVSYQDIPRVNNGVGVVLFVQCTLKLNTTIRFIIVKIQG